MKTRDRSIVEQSSTTLFNELLKQNTQEWVADNLFLHKGTVKRWMKENRVPETYKHDLLRLLGVKDYSTNDAREDDMFYTKPDIAIQCLKRLQSVACDLHIDLSQYRYIEPSAGCGCFYNLLPKGSIGIDINPYINNIIKSDYLRWYPKDDIKSVVVGNPPFGLRGNKALQFINHSYNFADIVAFILPQLFNSDGKGSTMSRVKGYQLAHTEYLPDNSFYYPDGRDVNVATIFQIWTKVNTHKIKKPAIKTCDNFIKIYSMSDGGTPSSTRNKAMIGKCDVYLPSTTYRRVLPVYNFEELPHRRGYGIVILNKQSKIKKLLMKNDWNKTAFKSTNSALNLRMSLIKEIVTNAGFFDKELSL